MRSDPDRTGSDDRRCAVPLFDRDPTDIILHEPGGPVRCAEFERRVLRLSSRLPDARYALNLCDDRRHFLTAFAAVIDAGLVNLLPPNRQTHTVSELIDRYRDVIIVHDGSVAGMELPCAALDVRQAANDARDVEPTDGVRPSASPDALAAISFTSGSTGRPGANQKRWATLRDGTAINARAMLDGLDPHGPINLLATVPPQHMYGLELSILLPMRAPVAVATGQPLYPADVVAALEALPEPRALVTTPAHLRALLGSGLILPCVRRLYSATAPLSRELAQASETAFGGELVEIYGCSEVGSIARRATAHDDVWQVFDGLTLQPVSSTTRPGVSYRVSAAHLDEAPELQDALDILAPDTFRLRGRAGDLLNIAGKRGSLAEINRRLLDIPGVHDAVAFQPRGGRLAAIVVAQDSLRRESIVSALRTHLDPVFVPRPILFADALPRQASSKLLPHDVQALHDRLLGRRDRAQHS